MHFSLVDNYSKNKFNISPKKYSLVILIHIFQSLLYDPTNLLLNKQKHFLVNCRDFVALKGLID